jgi:hypothetical protein
VYDPWAFGWTQLFTLIGLGMSGLFAFLGLRTFEKWKREKLEERKIEIAFDALSLAHESKYVFAHIRNVMSYDFEYKDMPKKPGASEIEWGRRGPYYAILGRINQNKDFFEKAWKLQPRCTAMFGTDAEEIFLLMHKARREIEVSAQMLLWQEVDDETMKEFQRDIWDRGEFEKEKDRIGKKLAEFRERVETLFRPVIDRQYGKKPPSGMLDGPWKESRIDLTERLTMS